MDARSRIRFTDRRGRSASAAKRNVPFYPAPRGYARDMSETRHPDLKVFREVDFSALDEADGPRVRRLDTPMRPLVEVAVMATLLTAGSVLVFAVGGVIGSAIEADGPRLATYLSWGAAALALFGGALWFLLSWFRRHGRPLPSVVSRLREFADRNDLEYLPRSVADATLPAAAGQAHQVQRVSHRLRPAEGSPWPGFELGYRMFHRPVPPDFTPTAKNPYPVTILEGWYVAIPLPTALPHIALLRREDRTASHLDQEAQYSMGVEFDATFTLLCPPGYERDALYLFTPDVMAAMLDDAGSAQFGAEVLDDHLFFRFPVATISGTLFAEDVRRAFLLVERTAAELAKQATLYRDERSPDRTLRLIAPAGQRVRTRVRPTSIATAFGLPLMVLAPFAMIMVASFAA